MYKKTVLIFGETEHWDQKYLKNFYNKTIV